MKTILVPVDFSKNSENALRYALLLAEKLKSKLFLFHSYYTPHASGHLSVKNTDSGKKIGHDLAVQELTDFYNQCLPPATQVVEYLSSQRELREALPKIVQENNIDLIVMGTQGIGWLEGQIFGTNTSWTIENIHCPLIAIPEKETALQIKHIAYASDYLESDIANLKTVAQIASPFEADTTVVHVEPDTAVAERTLNAFKERLQKEVDPPPLAFISLKASDVEESLEDYLRQYPVDLLVMSAQRHDLFDKLLGNSITKQMVQRLSRPIMFFHHNPK